MAQVSRIVVSTPERSHIYVGRDSRMMNIANRIAPRRSTHMIQKKMEDLLA